MNAQEGREQHQASRAGKAAIRSTPIMISPSVSEVNLSHLAVGGYFEQATLSASSFDGMECHNVDLPL